jgi:alginate O-acetyltransferase complex protein AlgI
MKDIMQYVSIGYLFCFMPLLMLVYSLLPGRQRWKVLLAASYVFYILMSGKLLIFLLVSTLLLYFTGLRLEKYVLMKADGRNARKRLFACSAVFYATVLFLMKYLNFIDRGINLLLARTGTAVSVPYLKLVMPLGISFFTLQAISYLSDLSQGKIKAEHKLGRLALYMAFFPTIMEGPICRYGDTAEALYEGRDITYKNAAHGTQRMIWGLFKKLVVADRLAPLVMVIFDGYIPRPGGAVDLFGAACYTLQLYADFSGCVDISIGTAEIFGITLPENFRQPFFAPNASEFWRRWHITLGTWLRDYVFYPMCLKKYIQNIGRKARKRFGMHPGQVIQTVIPLFAVWICNGLWHGTGWHYIFYGMYYFVIINLENAAEPAIHGFTAHTGINEKGFGWRALQTVKMTFVIIIGEMFFRAEGLRLGFRMLGDIFTRPEWSELVNGYLLRLTVSKADLAAAAAGAAVMLAVDIMHEKGICIRDSIDRLHAPARWGIYYAAIIIVLIFGAYGAGYVPVDPMYAGF